MKAIVIKAFRDKETKAVYEEDDEIEVTKKRFAAINKHRAGPFLVEIEDKGPVSKPPEGPAMPDSDKPPEGEPPAGC